MYKAFQIRISVGNGNISPAQFYLTSLCKIDLLQFNLFSFLFTIALLKQNAQAIRFFFEKYSSTRLRAIFIAMLRIGAANRHAYEAS